MTEAKTRRYRVGAFLTAYKDETAARCCLQAILKQTHPVADILVIDNSPVSVLAATALENAQILHCPENLGVSGAFRQALEWSQQKGYDFLWGFDQDSEPAPDCLEQLLVGYVRYHDPEKLPIGQVAPLVWDTATGRYIGGANYKEFRFQELGVQPGSSQGYQECASPITSGCLIALAAARQVRSPNPALFMDGVDLDYGLSMQQSGFRSLIVYKANMQHHLGDPLKITWLGRPRFIQNYSPLRTYYFYRNHCYLELAYAVGRVNRGMALLHRLKCVAKELVSTLLYRPRKLAKSRACLLGSYHGLIGRLGKLERL